MSEHDDDLDPDDMPDPDEGSRAEPDKSWQDNQKQAFERLKRKHEKELAKVREDAEQSVRREFTAKGLAKDLGLNDELASIYLEKLGGSDPTEDGFKEFAGNLGWKFESPETERDEEKPAPAGSPVDAKAAAVFHQGGGTPTSPTARVTSKEALEKVKVGVWSDTDYKRYLAEKYD